MNFVNLLFRIGMFREEWQLPNRVTIIRMRWASAGQTPQEVVPGSRRAALCFLEMVRAASERLDPHVQPEIALSIIVCGRSLHVRRERPRHLCVCCTEIPLDRSTGDIVPAHARLLGRDAIDREVIAASFADGEGA